MRRQRAVRRRFHLGHHRGSRTRLYAWRRQLNVVSVNMSLGGSTVRRACDKQPYKPIIDNLRSIGIATVVASGKCGGIEDLDAGVHLFRRQRRIDRQVRRASRGFRTSPRSSHFWRRASRSRRLCRAAYSHSFSGTSMAAPHVAGAWACSKRRCRARASERFSTRSRETGQPISDTESFGTATIPRVSLFEALATLAPVENPAAGRDRDVAHEAGARQRR